MNNVTLREDIWSAPASELSAILARAGYRLIEIDDRHHDGRQPDGESQAIMWRHLDTAYQILREGALRYALEKAQDLLSERAPDGLAEETVAAMIGDDSLPDNAAARTKLYGSFAGLAEHAGLLLVAALEEVAEESGS